MEKKNNKKKKLKIFIIKYFPNQNVFVRESGAEKSTP